MKNTWKKIKYQIYKFILRLMFGDSKVLVLDKRKVLCGVNVPYTLLEREDFITLKEDNLTLETFNSNVSTREKEFKEIGKEQIDDYEVILAKIGDDLLNVHINGFGGNPNLTINKYGRIVDFYGDF